MERSGLRAYVAIGINLRNPDAAEIDRWPRELSPRIESRGLKKRLDLGVG